ncbi:MAG: site-specific DNA-methyltransferase [Chloroflexi bacterium]|nr:site-specific DNA-methyltransferase [Chloroflexota bacterium]
MGHHDPTHEPNRLIWGDNLHVMRQLPSNSVDLIYIDPPFFSGKEYNVMWGDSNELRSFNDIWEGGLDGYLIWLNARLYEMKRLLKTTGSIYVHCDWHASHYIKVEMDRIFGNSFFMNEVIWHYKSFHGNVKRYYPRKHDVLLVYTKPGKWTFNRQYDENNEDTIDFTRWNEYLVDGYKIMGSNMPMQDSRFTRFYRRWVKQNGREPGPDDVVYEVKGQALDTVWDIKPVDPKDSEERIGYPTQKPETLLERIISASSYEGDVVADFFVGGGTTAAVAQRLGRHFIACDQSRVAIAVTAERLKQQAQTRAMGDEYTPDFTVEQWGIYEAERLSDMPVDQFRDFVLRAYGASRIGQTGDGPHIHGWRNQLPIWVGEPELVSQATAADVQDFANAIRRSTQYQQANLRDGIMLAWGFRPDALAAAEQLRQLADVDVNFIRLKQVSIGDADFREHIIGRSTDKADYGEFLTFVQPPVVNVGYRSLGGGSVTFDAGDTAVINLDAEVVNVQWDFEYNGRRFSATPGYSFQKNKKPQLRVTHKFSSRGKRRIACRVQDSRGGEGIWVGEVEVN